MSEEYTLSYVFTHYLASSKLLGHLEEIVKALAKEGVQSFKLRDLLPLREEEEYLAIQSNLLDLILFYVMFCLEDHYLTPQESNNVYYLKTAFHVDEEDLFNHKYDQIEQLLSSQISRALNDQNVNRAEALQQVELQRCFGLNYDQFLQITRPYVDEIIDRLFRLIIADGAVTQNERIKLVQQILDLNTVYFLTAEQKKLLDTFAN